VSGKRIASVTQEKKGKVAEEKTTTFQLRGQDPLQAVPALYSNFVAISRVGTDVQLEFVFMDLNQIAMILQARAESKGDEAKQQLVGKTVAKIVMPGACFLQVKDHINQIFGILEKALNGQEAENERDRASSL